MNPRKFQEALFRGNRDANLRFQSMRRYLGALGFRERVSGSHHIWSHPDLEDILNLQPEGSSCKEYQVREVRKLLAHYKMRL